MASLRCGRRGHVRVELVPCIPPISRGLLKRWFSFNAAHAIRLSSSTTQPASHSVQLYFLFVMSITYPDDTDACDGYSYRWCSEHDWHRIDAPAGDGIAESRPFSHHAPPRQSLSARKMRLATTFHKSTAIRSTRCSHPPSIPVGRKRSHHC